MEGGIGCGGQEATVRRGYLAEVAVRASPPRGVVASVELPAPVRDGRTWDLVDDVRAAWQHLREQVAEMGPDLVQSGLLAILDLRLPETYSRARRVARASMAMARSMRLPEADVQAIRCAALLHDVGKIAIPTRLLRHGGPLGDHEAAVLRMHATIGADLVADVPSLEGVAPLIAATHERYDGAGYPRRLAGAEIPVGARIIAVADCYDAMMTPRPYCEPVTREEAHNEMVRCSGSHFDPAVVREWLAILGSWGCPVTVARPRVTPLFGPSGIPVRAHR